METQKPTGRRTVMALTHCAGETRDVCLDILRMLLLLWTRYNRTAWAGCGSPCNETNSLCSYAG